MAPPERPHLGPPLASVIQKIKPPPGRLRRGVSTLDQRSPFPESEMTQPMSKSFAYLPRMLNLPCQALSASVLQVVHDDFQCF